MASVIGRMGRMGRMRPSCDHAQRWAQGRMRGRVRWVTPVGGAHHATHATYATRAASGRRQTWSAA